MILEPNLFMENSGIEPLIPECKSGVSPTTLIPHNGVVIHQLMIKALTRCLKLAPIVGNDPTSFLINSQAHSP